MADADQAHPAEGDIVGYHGGALVTAGEDGDVFGEGDYVDGDVTVTAVPRYAMPNIASILPGFANSEQDHIGRAFASANYDSLQRVPSDLDYGTVNAARQQVMESVRKPFVPQLPTGSASIPKAINKNGLFQEFEYLPSRYSLADELATTERLESEAARMQISGTNFAPCGGLKKLKHEDGFEDESRFRYMNDPYESAQDMILRQKWLEESRILCGPFVPSGSDAKLQGRPTKVMARDIINALQALICEDWEGTNVAIYANEEEQWVIRFEMNTVDSEPGLVAYMNILLRCNDVVQKYKLTKVVEHWNVKPGDGFMYFTLRPPWVKSKPVDSYYALHPEERIHSIAAA